MRFHSFVGVLAKYVQARWYQWPRIPFGASPRLWTSYRFESQQWRRKKQRTHLFFGLFSRIRGRFWRRTKWRRAFFQDMARQMNVAIKKSIALAEKGPLHKHSFAVQMPCKRTVATVAQPKSPHRFRRGTTFGSSVDSVRVSAQAGTLVLRRDKRPAGV